MQKFFNFLGKFKGLWRILIVVFALIFLLGFIVGELLETNKGQVNRYLGTATEMVDVPDDSNAYSIYTPDYVTEKGTGDSSALIKAHEEIGAQVGAEGSVLLKNDNDALPLVNSDYSDASDLDITLFGVASAPSGTYYGMSMGGTVEVDCVSLYDALTSKGANVNKDMNDYYESKATSSANTNAMATVYNYVSGAQTYPYYEVDPTASGYPSVTGNYSKSSKASGTETVGIVVVGRPSSEGGDYYPGSEGIDQSLVSNSATTGNVLGFTDAELNTIKTAKNSCDKVIVLINATNAMELGPVMSGDYEADAILWIGFPGAYGYNGVADILLGNTSPSGHLSDTYAYDSTSSAAMQNFGNYQYSNYLDVDPAASGYPSLWATKYLVEAEGIYDGYKYYETRYEDTVLGEGNADSSEGAFASTTTKNGSVAWTYDEEVAYPFGYGLSYTNFTQTIGNTDHSGENAIVLDKDAKTVTVYYTVKNEGTVAGMSVVQVYGQAPYYLDGNTVSNVEKASVVLLNYDKTPELASGATYEGSVTIDLQNLASYDETVTNSADNTKTGQYILDAGTYYISLGDNNNAGETGYQEGAHAALNNILTAKGKSTEDGMDYTGDEDAVATFSLTSDDYNLLAKDPTTGEVVSNELQSADLNTYKENTVNYLSRSDWTWNNGWNEANWSADNLKGYTNITATEDMNAALQGSVYTPSTSDDVSDIKFDQPTDLTLSDMVDENGNVQDYDSEDWNELIDSLNLEEALTFIGQGNRTYPDLTGMNFLGGTYVENGPTGLAVTMTPNEASWSIPSGDKNGAYKFDDMGCETLQACTWNQELLYDIGVLWGNDSLFSSYPMLWAPSLNLHRTPYNGRSAEYYSEDPILSGYQASGLVMGAQTKGLVAAVKHFIANDQECNRYGLGVFASEQQLREGELRGFQITFEYGQAAATMTSYCRVGCTLSCANEGLMSGILRGEWQFHGYAISDYAVAPKCFVYTESVKAGVSTFDNADITFWDTAENFAKLYANDATMLQAVKDSVHTGLWGMAHSNMVNFMVAGAKNVSVMNWWRRTYYAMEYLGGIVAGLALIAYVLSEIVPVKKKEQEA